jgi:hypothetical protein
MELGRSGQTIDHAAAAAPAALVRSAARASSASFSYGVIDNRMAQLLGLLCEYHLIVLLGVRATLAR